MDQKTSPPVTVCIGCEGGAALAAALGDQAQTVACMNVCDQPATVSLRAAGKWAYLFGNVTPAMAAEVSALAALYDAAADGDITDARSIPQLRHCLIGRVPA